MSSILIGIPAKNEEKSIYDCLISLERSLRHFNSSKDIDIIVGLHECVDHSKEKALLAFKRFNSPNILLKCINVKGYSIVDVQNKIFKAGKKKYDYIVFLDADIVINKAHIKNLLNPLITNPNFHAAYANTIPIISKNSFIGRMMIVYDSFKNLRNKRLYINGKSFAVREWLLVKANRLAINRAQNISGYHSLELQKGLLTDDIILSRLIVDKYGVKSIKEVLDAKVFYHPINSLPDLYKYNRRIRTDLIRLSFLFPEHEYIQKAYFRRKTVWGTFIKQNLSVKIYWLSFIFLNRVINIYLKLRFALNQRLNLFQEGMYWQPTNSTKKDLVKATLHRLILFEGMDCSGKKTIAYEVAKRLNEQGIDTTVNVGPLVKNWYYNLSRLCIRYPNMPDFLKSIIFSVEPLIDGVFYNPEHLVTIQSSSFIRSMAWAMSFNKKLYLKMINYNSKFYPKIAKSYYFHAPYQIRIERHRKLSALKETFEDENKRFIANNPQRYFAWEKALEKLCKNYNLVRKYDTSKKTAQDIVNEIVNEVVMELNT